MNSVLILQSYRQREVPQWIDRCLDSVRAWALREGYAYRFSGDELFARLPGWYAAKVGQRRPIAADLARLLWIQESLLANHFEVVAWFDADVFIMAPEALQIAPQTTCAFGYEYWLTAQDGNPGFRIRKNVHNAYCAFRRDCPILPFLIEAVQRMVRRVDPAFIAPQFVGPKLLSSLHNIVGFEIDPRIGAISPLLGEALLGEAGGVEQGALTALRRALPEPLLAANLCASLQADGHSGNHVAMDKLLDLLGTLKSGLK